MYLKQIFISSHLSPWAEIRPQAPNQPSRTLSTETAAYYEQLTR